MATTRVAIEIGDLQGQRLEQLNARVDARATFTQIPSSVLQRLGVAELREITCCSPDGRISREQVGEARLRLEGREFTTTLLFCGDEEPPVVGIVALGTALLSVDEATGRLVPVLARTRKWLPPKLV